MAAGRLSVCEEIRMRWCDVPGYVAAKGCEGKITRRRRDGASLSMICHKTWRGGFEGALQGEGNLGQSQPGALSIQQRCGVRCSGGARGAGNKKPLWQGATQDGDMINACTAHFRREYSGRDPFCRGHGEMAAVGATAQS
jgi:hypothetical protein